MDAQHDKKTPFQSLIVTKEELQAVLAANEQLDRQLADFNNRCRYKHVQQTSTNIGQTQSRIQQQHATHRRA